MILGSTVRRGAILAVGVALVFANGATAAKRSVPITKPKFDPGAKRVALFEGVDKGSLNVKMVARDSFGGSLVIENKSDKPLTVEMPDAFVGVQVLRQLGGGAGGARGGAAQAVGGGVGGGVAGGNFGGGGGGGVFSIPAEKLVKIPFQSVCLEHGKTEPDSTMTYRVMPVEKYSDNSQLSTLLSLVGSGRIRADVAQAAAWHLASQMSWEQLATKESTEIGQSDRPYFSREALYRAQQLVAEVRGLAREREKKAQSKPDTTPPRRGIVGR